MFQSVTTSSICHCCQAVSIHLLFLPNCQTCDGICKSLFCISEQKSSIAPTYCWTIPAFLPFSFACILSNYSFQQHLSSPPIILTCLNRKSCSACLSLCSLSSCSCGSGGSCLMTRPRSNPVSDAEVEEEDDEDEESPWCSLSSSSVSSGWLWCCLPGPEAPELAAEIWSPGLDII